MLDSDDHEILSHRILVVTWVLFSISVAFLIARAAAKVASSQRFSADDYVVALALVLSGIQSALVTQQTSNSLGSYIGTASLYRIEEIRQKLEYAATFIYISSIFTSEISLVIYLHGLTPVTAQLERIIQVGGAVTVLTIINIFNFAFQCGAARPWDYLRENCPRRDRIVYLIEISNFILNLTLIILPVHIIRQLQTTKIRKFTFSLGFLIRILVLLAIVAKLVIWSMYFNASTTTFDFWRVIICNQVIQCLAIVSTCAVKLRRWFELIESAFSKNGALDQQTLIMGTRTGHRRINSATIFDERSQAVTRNSMEGGTSDELAAAEGGRRDVDSGSRSSSAGIVPNAVPFRVHTSDGRGI